MKYISWFCVAVWALGLKKVRHHGNKASLMYIMLCDSFSIHFLILCRYHYDLWSVSFLNNYLRCLKHRMQLLYLCFIFFHRMRSLFPIMCTKPWIVSNEPFNASWYLTDIHACNFACSLINSDWTKILSVYLHPSNECIWYSPFSTIKHTRTGSTLLAGLVRGGKLQHVTLLFMVYIVIYGLHCYLCSTLLFMV